jgi:hypothetical protein
MHDIADEDQTVRELRAYALAPERAAVKLNQNENP